MSYRNDHDAALNRVVALEGELARLRADQPNPAWNAVTLPPVAPPRSRVALGAVGMLLAVALAAIGGFAKATHAEVPVPAARSAGAAEGEAMAPPIPWNDSLGACIAAVDRTVMLDAASTDPRGASPQSVDVLARTAAPCREEIHAWTGDAMIAEPVAAWSRAEEELVGAISRITVYYGSDPYAINHYATANQLWREYGQARAVRDAAMMNVSSRL